ncbi:MAG TPA: laccase domain-containing protein, partial [Nakamurella sp.]
MFSTRHGGVSAPPFDSLNLGGGVGDDPAAVEVNRDRLAVGAGLPRDRIVWMRQVHGTTVTRVGTPADRPARPDPGPALRPVEQADGIVTNVTDLAVAVLVADCVPILAGDPAAGVVAAVHAGRRGAAGGIGLRALRRMIAAGAAVENIEVWL